MKGWQTIKMIAGAIVHATSINSPSEGNRFVAATKKALQ